MPHSPADRPAATTRPEPIPERPDSPSGSGMQQAARAIQEGLSFGEVPPTAGQPSVPRLANLRDLGGWRTTDGRTVRSGLLFRSVAPDRLEAPGLAAFADLGVRTVYDLRTVAEREAAPDRVPDGVEIVTLDVLAAAEQAAPAHLTELFSDPATVNSQLGGGRAEELFASAYRGFVSLPSARDSYRALFTGLADPSRRPALFHCTTGKDRTGWASAALLTWLGVPDEDVLAEYLLTNELLRPALQSVYDRFTAAGGDPQILEAILGVRAGYLATAFEEMRTAFGSIEDYITTGLGLPAEVQAGLRSGLLEG
jgi:protein-tyrosine phosphatase